MLHTKNYVQDVYRFFMHIVHAHYLAWEDITKNPLKVV